MRNDAITLEESRLEGIEGLDQYPWFKERHRIFPAIFESRDHKRIIDTSAGVGVAAQRIMDNYPAALFCNEISPSCIKMLTQMGICTMSFDLDNDGAAYPFAAGSFDAAISLVTIEHLLNIDNMIEEIHRILEEGGYLYIATPNYAAPEYLKNMLLSSRTFHNPLSTGLDRYEFYGHVRYFTYRTLVDYVSSFGFIPDTVYIALPKGSTRYMQIHSRSKVSALALRYGMWLRHLILGPRWASEPVVCFQKTSENTKRAIRRVLL